MPGSPRVATDGASRSNGVTKLWSPPYRGWRSFAATRRHWDEVVAIHARSAFYDLDGFKRGACALSDIELSEIGDVAGRTLLHLQCHFGMGSLSWARLGAQVTGVDFSEQAIALARSLSEELDISAEFV